MKCMVCLALAWVCLVSLAEALAGAQIAQDLRSTLSSRSRIYLPTDEGWPNEITQRFNSWNGPTYVVAVKPAVKEDVQKVVKYAAQNNVSFLATGGGHGYSGTLSALDHGIELDMGNFKTVSVNAATNRISVGGSVKFADMMVPTYSAGKAIPVGGCSCVGITGATLGGGIGFYSGMYGATSDSLVSAEIVLASGKLITASEHKNAELFWGIKGAGSNFGVVTSLTFKVYDPPSAGQVMNADMMFPVGLNGSLWKFASSWVGKQPKELSIMFSMLFDPISQQLLIIANIIYAGPLSKGQALIQPLLDLHPFNLNITYLPWKDIPDSANYGFPAQSCTQTGMTSIPYTVNLYQINFDVLIAATKFLSDSFLTTPALRGSLIAFTQYAPHGFQLYSDKSSAFPHRDVILYVQLEGAVLNPTDSPAIDSFGQNFRDLLQQSSGRKDVYTHFANGDEGPVAWYSARNVRRLRALKALYDKEGVFSFYNPV
ncbi:hypothetical protein BJ875DRAFT_482938 [Amylocarpus encephaloides]|uniref:FAD-binding PCMH-type domain-containing protein n=1 Tax=Amylocarpus encephaloides TaxID=45428 RepID=A0A9P7YMI5_9HELO|nr:hypothetical protein BJ875DRAFT_482938 [Amylocarpus encephaloides]